MEEKSSTVDPSVSSRRVMVSVPIDSEAPAVERTSVVFELDKIEVHYGAFRAVRDVSLQVRAKEITAFIGPSGCGKTTVLRCLNRMNDLVSGARVGGRATYQGVDLYGA